MPLRMEEVIFLQEYVLEWFSDRVKNLLGKRLKVAYAEAVILGGKCGTSDCIAYQLGDIDLLLLNEWYSS